MLLSEGFGALGLPEFPETALLAIDHVQQGHDLVISQESGHPGHVSPGHIHDKGQIVGAFFFTQGNQEPSGILNQIENALADALF